MALPGSGSHKVSFPSGPRVVICGTTSPGATMVRVLSSMASIFGEEGVRTA